MDLMDLCMFGKKGAGNCVNQSWGCPYISNDNYRLSEANESGNGTSDTKMSSGMTFPEILLRPQLTFQVTIFELIFKISYPDDFSKSIILYS